MTHDWPGAAAPKTGDETLRMASRLPHAKQRPRVGDVFERERNTVRVIPEVAVRFEANPLAVSAARHFVVHTLRRWDLAVFPADLVISELASNAVRHASTAFTVRIARIADTVLIEVANGHPLLPSPREASGDAEAGRGLALVDALTLSWGAKPRSQGKAVWFTVRAEPTTASAGTDEARV